LQPNIQRNIMTQPAAIVLVEDDVDDQQLFQLLMDELQIVNEIKIFGNCAAAFEYLKAGPSPFLIVCDINLPGLNGLEFKARIDEDPELRAKSVPFVFLTTTADKRTVEKAYASLTIQGFFQKCNKMDDLKRSVRTVYDYWLLCKHPNSI
jgi:CheY-like chemotaxis protein